MDTHAQEHALYTCMVCVFETLQELHTIARELDVEGI